MPPPRIVESQAEPPRRLVRDFGAAGLCELEFAVLVEDPDVDDLIAVRWYFDYNSSNPTGPNMNVSKRHGTTSQ